MKGALLLVAAALLCSSPAAGTITIDITPTVELREGELALTVEVRNSGDEAAHSVTPLLRFRGDEVRGASHPALAPNQSLKASLTAPVGDLGEGRWPYLVVVEYADAGQYPFQALSAATVAVGSPPPVKVAVPRFESEEIRGGGELAFQVKNLSASERRVSLELLLPEALEATGPSQEIALEPWELRNVELSLVNRAALPGSRYPVFLAVEYDDGPVHQALVAQSAVGILAGEKRQSPRALHLWIAAGVVGVLFVVMVAVRVVRR